MDFITGELSLIVMVDLGQIEAIASENGYKAIFASDQPWVLEFRSADDQPQLQMSYHLLGRVFYEFTSLANLLIDGFNRIKNIETNAHDENSDQSNGLNENNEANKLNHQSQ
jgi:hypothetical protein